MITKWQIGSWQMKVSEHGTLSGRKTCPNFHDQKSIFKEMVACLFEKLGMLQPYHIKMQKSLFWMVRNHLLARCLPRNQENQPSKTNYCLPPHVSSHISARTIAMLSTQNILMNHSSYSPDLTTNDFLFPYL